MRVMFGEARAGSTAIGGLPIPDEPDLDRMRAERSAKVREQMTAQSIDVLLALGTSAVHYTTGAAMPAVDAGRACLLRPVALVHVDDPVPHLFTPYPDGAAGRLPDDHVHPPLLIDIDEAVAAAAKTLADYIGPGTQLAADELTPPLLAALDQLGPGRDVGNGQAVLGPARIIKTVDELACTRTAQRINEDAMAEVYEHLAPGVTQRELTGRFLHEAFDRGATGTGIDTIWQVMPDSLAAGPWTVHDDAAYPTPPGNETLVSGDVLWVDSGVLYEGYPSDFGRTWLVDATPTAAQQEQFERWRSVMWAALHEVRPGATGADVCRAARAADPVTAAAGTNPWLDHFYLVHGIGVDSAEMPLLGTDLGERFDESVVLAPGMVLVLEPVIWVDGTGGYRSEDIVVVTDDGWAPLSDFTYEPFADTA